MFWNMFALVQQFQSFILSSFLNCFPEYHFLSNIPRSARNIQSFIFEIKFFTNTLRANHPFVLLSTVLPLSFPQFVLYCSTLREIVTFVLSLLHWLVTFLSSYCLSSFRLFLLSTTTWFHIKYPFVPPCDIILYRISQTMTWLHLIMIRCSDISYLQDVHNGCLMRKYLWKNVVILFICSAHIPCCFACRYWFSFIWRIHDIFCTSISVWCVLLIYCTFLRQHSLCSLSGKSVFNHFVNAFVLKFPVCLIFRSYCFIDAVVLFFGTSGFAVVLNLISPYFPTALWKQCLNTSCSFAILSKSLLSILFAI